MVLRVPCTAFVLTHPESPKNFGPINPVKAHRCTEHYWVVHHRVNLIKARSIVESKLHLKEQGFIRRVHKRPGSVIHCSVKVLTFTIYICKIESKLVLVLP